MIIRELRQITDEDILKLLEDNLILTRKSDGQLGDMCECVDKFTMFRFALDVIMLAEGGAA